MNRAELRREWRASQKRPPVTSEQVRAAIIEEAARQRARERLMAIAAEGHGVHQYSLWERLWAWLRRIL